MLALLPLLSFSQTLHFKVGGGFASHYGSDSRPVGAFKIGLGYEIELNQRWSFTPGIEVYGKGWKTPDETAPVFDLDGNPAYNDDGTRKTGIISRSATANYISVPLLFSHFIRTGEARYVVLSAGPYVAYAVTGKQKIKGDTSLPASERYFYEKHTFDIAGTHRFDFGVQTFAGYQFPSGFTVGLEADWGIAKFSSDGKRNVSALISLGYKL